MQRQPIASTSKTCYACLVAKRSQSSFSFDHVPSLLDRLRAVIRWPRSTTRIPPHPPFDPSYNTNLIFKRHKQIEQSLARLSDAQLLNRFQKGSLFEWAQNPHALWSHILALEDRQLGGNPDQIAAAIRESVEYNFQIRKDELGTARQDAIDKYATRLMVTHDKVMQHLGQDADQIASYIEQCRTTMSILAHIGAHKQAHQLWQDLGTDARYMSAGAYAQNYLASRYLQTIMRAIENSQRDGNQDQVITLTQEAFEMEEAMANQGFSMEIANSLLLRITKQTAMDSTFQKYLSQKLMFTVDQLPTVDSFRGACLSRHTVNTILMYYGQRNFSKMVAIFESIREGDPRLINRQAYWQLLSAANENASPLLARYFFRLACSDARLQLKTLRQELQQLAHRVERSDIDIAHQVRSLQMPAILVDGSLLTLLRRTAGALPATNRIRNGIQNLVASSITYHTEAYQSIRTSYDVIARQTGSGQALLKISDHLKIAESCLASLVRQSRALPKLESRRIALRKTVEERLHPVQDIGEGKSTLLESRPQESVMQQQNQYNVIDPATTSNGVHSALAT